MVVNKTNNQSIYYHVLTWSVITEEIVQKYQSKESLSVLISTWLARRGETSMTQNKFITKYSKLISIELSRKTMEVSHFEDLGCLYTIHIHIHMWTTFHCHVQRVFQASSFRMDGCELRKIYVQSYHFLLFITSHDQWTS